MVPDQVRLIRYGRPRLDGKREHREDNEIRNRRFARGGTRRKSRETRVDERGPRPALRAPPCAWAEHDRLSRTLAQSPRTLYTHMPVQGGVGKLKLIMESSAGATAGARARLFGFASVLGCFFIFFFFSFLKRSSASATSAKPLHRWHAHHATAIETADRVRQKLCRDHHETAYT